MSQADVSYKAILNHVLSVGELRKTRTGSVISTFAPPEFRFDMRSGFPLITSKQTFMRQVLGEALWFMNGENQLGHLRYRTWGENDGERWTIWTDDFKRWLKTTYATENDWLEDAGGRIYGVQWRAYEGHGGVVVDQLSNLVEKMRKSPTDRYMLVNAWNAADISSNYMALAPCHVLFQIYISNTNEVDLKWYQRSCDTFLGLPFNIASYAFILEVLCKLTGYTPRYLVGTYGDTQIYQNHMSQVFQLLGNEEFPAPKFEIHQDLKSLEDLRHMTADDFLGGLKGYKHAGKIEAPLSVGK
ncbi:dTMP synthase [Shigella phage Sf18]|uniref:thymidylate synthase n=1 Tax=Shigella phage Sf18 TaxID=2024319 RepID=A0A291AZ54_9CAUD|nr:dTMP synthase [Shigella phage Sf18]